MSCGSRRRRLRLFALVTGALGVVAVAVAPAAAAAPAPAVLTGTVTGADGRPLGNVTVAFVVPDVRGGQTVERSTRTNSAGTYTFTGDLGTTDEYLQFTALGVATGGTSATGYSDLCYGGPAPLCSEAAGRTVTVAAGTRRTVNATLQRAGLVTGRAVDTAGRGVGRMPVTVWYGGYDFSDDTLIRPVAFGQTDVNGNYRVPVSATTYTVCIGQPDGVTLGATPGGRFGYVGNCSAVNGVKVAPGATVARSARLVAGGALGGTVVGADGKPIAGATVVAISRGGPFDLFPPSTKSGSAGTFTVYGLVPGATGWCVDAPDYRESCSTKDVTVRSSTVTSIGTVVLQLVS